MEVLAWFRVYGSDGKIVSEISEKFRVEGLPADVSYNHVIRSAMELGSEREASAASEGRAGERYNLASVHIWEDPESIVPRCIYESFPWELVKFPAAQ